MSFRSLMNDLCNIYETATTQDPDTGEEIITDILIAQAVPCGFQNGSDSIYRSQPLQAGVNNDRLFIFPQAFEFKKHVHIIEVRGNKYNINAPVDLGGRKKYMELSLELITLKD